MLWSPNIEDKVFIVTGGAAGVGGALVNRLLSENARSVVFLDVNEHEGAALEIALHSKFGPLKAKFIKCDVSDESQLAAAFRQVLDKYNKLDCVINNAAVLANDDQFRRMIDINFTATVSSTLKAVDIMSAKGGGTVLNVSSLLALTPHSHLPVYGATKTAVLQFSNSVGAEEYYVRTKVRVMTVCLGPTDTAILQRQYLDNFDKDCTGCLASRAPERQRVESAANGIVEVIKRGLTGSTWIVANDKPAVDVTEEVRYGTDVLPQVTTDELIS
ncbi:15-hydroxyprostaglandin dehydrogenase [NAD(+)]-like [Pectinophora gossypiella]|uniref:15-hydroxyprostaglandin dehydrogenase [NAD(+)]-like n=1 Tax=Pectinophora gossypiella TaxID=13191 RepID=UPI00214EA5C1|nr:15-hydroxyprostaglandin dehydrogenase [NAD(+)]-like [Pectinophora gossypiella]XP_049866992.1 15-hydroxyprostaglandin dehydrogenase [NAD(+)]-like [Pectinophora gossypiella]XP_049866993.1 15-hydroxyprostaglandin dehydrogenase [NAD(+)]-like [Pectinophora gossypiella]